MKDIITSVRTSSSSTYGISARRKINAVVVVVSSR